MAKTAKKAATDKAAGKYTVKVGGRISNGKGGFYEAGDKIDPVDPKSLKEKGLIE